ncbi:MAG: aminotransferase class I/II-fold pyridoxal phosphate-dependent enzyme [Thaumarchaeota archaeon]|nr:aminotransferase class I/II-fold pyridoxal phosphate-dependent enzyme [Nitrososphaerota archaeon]
MKREAELQGLRDEVSRVTKEIISLIAERNDVARKIGHIKTEGSLPIEDEGVEDTLLKEVLADCERAGVDREVGNKIFNILVSESKRIQGQNTIQPVLVTPMTIASKAMELQRKGKRLVRLDIGEPNFEPPRAVLEACSKALFDLRTRYSETRGIPELIEGLIRHLKKRHGYDAKARETIVTPGGRYAVYTALASILKEGDRCIVIEPNWPAYKEGIQFIGARPTTIHTTLEEGWEPHVETVKESIRSNTKAIVLSYPVNPTGKIIDPRVFSDLVALANDYGLTVISDEIYTDYAYKSCASILESKANRFILTSSFSKTWAMTGFRVGYAVSSEDVISKMMKMQSLMITCVPEFVQFGALKAIESEAEIRRNSQAMKERIEAASKELDKIGGLEYYKPDGAMYVFPRAKRAGFDSSTFAMKLLEEKNVTLAPGSGFGDYNNCFRISLGQSKETIIEGIRAIGELIS